MNKDYILRMSSKATGVSSPSRSRGGLEAAAAAGWEVRPGGMLVQQRNSDPNHVPNIKIKVKYGSSLSSRELKKMVAGLIGLNTQDQKLIFKGKERDSKSFLDICGVKNGSKIVLIEDELSVERRFIESLKNAKMEMASKQITAIGIEVDNLANQVLISLDGIAADEDIKLQRRMQVKRVQKYIETLDMLKIKNCGLGKVSLHQQDQIFTPKTLENQQEQRKQGRVNSGPVVVTTKWETF
ncbi:hypothetical protein CASFOL_010563 [Castilleja foliolosa]|uniref:Ubiquitin-like domain-containing protein n=1 Tax=Castilleja foliolosa TaxID=1961234 RepID=A0ABD3DSZ0_9LAMI